MRESKITVYFADELDELGLGRALSDYVNFLSEYGHEDENLKPTKEEFIDVSNANGYEYLVNGELYTGENN